MDTHNFEGAMRAFKRQFPFRPFAIALVNGDRFEVDHPDALIVRDGAAVYLGPGGVPVIFDHQGVSQVVGDLKEHSNP